MTGSAMPCPASYPVPPADIPTACPPDKLSCHDCFDFVLAPSLLRSPCGQFRLGWLLIAQDRKARTAVKSWADDWAVALPQREPFTIADFDRWHNEWRFRIVWIPERLRNRTAVMPSVDGKRALALLNPGDTCMWTCDLEAAPSIAAPVISTLAMESFGKLRPLVLPVYADE